MFRCKCPIEKEEGKQANKILTNIYEQEVSGTREQEAFDALDRYPNYLDFFLQLTLLLLAPPKIFAISREIVRNKPIHRMPFFYAILRNRSRLGSPAIFRTAFPLASVPSCSQFDR